MAALTQQKVAESAKIGQKVAKSTKSANGFDWLIERSQQLNTEKSIYHKASLSGQFRLGINPKAAINALSANLCHESQNELCLVTKEIFDTTKRLAIWPL